MLRVFLEADIKTRHEVETCTDACEMKKMLKQHIGQLKECLEIHPQQPELTRSFHEQREPKYRLQYALILIMGTPKWYPLSVGNPKLLRELGQLRCRNCGDEGDPGSSASWKFRRHRCLVPRTVHILLCSKQVCIGRVGSFCFPSGLCSNLLPRQKYINSSPRITVARPPCMQQNPHKWILRRRCTVHGSRSVRRGPQDDAKDDRAAAAWQQDPKTNSPGNEELMLASTNIQTRSGLFRSVRPIQMPECLPKQSSHIRPLRRCRTASH